MADVRYPELQTLIEKARKLRGLQDMKDFEAALRRRRVTVSTATIYNWAGGSTCPQTKADAQALIDVLGTPEAEADWLWAMKRDDVAKVA